MDEPVARLLSVYFSKAPYTTFFKAIRIRARCETVCAMKITNISSFGSIQNVVPPAPDQFISPIDPSIGLTPASVRTAKPSPNPKPGPGKYKGPGVTPEANPIWLEPM